MGWDQAHTRLGISGCGRAARIHVERLSRLDGVEIVGFADTDLGAASSLAQYHAKLTGKGALPAFEDHLGLLEKTSPTALAIFTPHLSHYRPAMDALQAGCHLFIEKPLSTNLQEATDIVGLARGRQLKVAVGHQYRLRASLVEARRMIRAGTIGRLCLVNATLAQPWLSSHGGAENSWRFDPKVSGGGILADAGDHLIDALLWMTSQVGVEVAAFQNKVDSGLDLVTAVSIRLSDGTLATLGVSGISPGVLFELNFFGDRGRLRVTDHTLEEAIGTNDFRGIDLPEVTDSIDGNFIAALNGGSALCCAADQALDTVRLLESIARSAASGQVIRVI